MTTRVQTKLGNYEIMIETGRVAKQSDGAVWVQSGGTVVLTTACAAMETKEGQDFFPLTVDYREKTYAAGKIPGGFFKREGKPSEKEVLTSRLIDRPIRPLFPTHYYNEIQITSTVLSVDGENNPDVLALIGASAALYISKVPFTTPIGAVRVGFMDGQYVLNPTYSELTQSVLDLIVAATENDVVMIEGGAKEISEAEMLGAIQFAQKHIKEQIVLQKELAAKK